MLHHCVGYFFVNTRKRYFCTNGEDTLTKKKVKQNVLPEFYINRAKKKKECTHYFTTKKISTKNGFYALTRKSFFI